MHPQSPLEEMLRMDVDLDRDIARFVAQLNYRDAQALKALFTEYPSSIAAYRLMCFAQNSMQTHDRPTCTVCS